VTMLRLSDILQQRDLFSVEKSESVADVARKMAGLRIGAILVLEGGTLRGIFSERDLMTRVVVEERDPAKTLVGEVMTSDLATADHAATVEEAVELMHRHKCRHLPVLSGGCVIGLVSMRDLTSVELEQRAEEIAQMRAYINGAA
jgi:signal-transduction protein with cAMP-binding, CBS, and nucleotidyltransferase domain